MYITHLAALSLSCSFQCLQCIHPAAQCLQCIHPAASLALSSADNVYTQPPSLAFCIAYNVYTQPPSPALPSAYNEYQPPFQAPETRGGI